MSSCCCIWCKTHPNERQSLYHEKGPPISAKNSLLSTSEQMKYLHQISNVRIYRLCGKMQPVFEPVSQTATKPTTSYSIGRLVPTTLQATSPLLLRSISQQYVVTASHLLSNAACCTFYVYPYKHTLPVRFITS